MLLLIRDLAPSDGGRLLAFYQSLSESVTRLFRPFDPVNEEVIWGHLAETEAGKHISIGLLTKDGTVKGHGFVLFLDKDKPVFGVGLHESAHGLGWGRILAQAVLDRADAQRIPLVTLTVIKTNSRAMSLYEKLRFVNKGEETYREKHDSYYMERIFPSGGQRRT